MGPSKNSTGYLLLVKNVWSGSKFCCKFNNLKTFKKTDLSVIISQVIYLLFEVIMARVEKLEKNTLWYWFCSFHSCFFTFLFLSSTLLISFLFLLFFISFVYAEQLLISLNFNLILLSIIRSFIHLFHYYFVSCYLCVLTDLPILIHVQQVKWQRVLSCGKDCDQVFSCYTVSCK